MTKPSENPELDGAWELITRYESIGTELESLAEALLLHGGSSAASDAHCVAILAIERWAESVTRILTTQLIGQHSKLTGSVYKDVDGQYKVAGSSDLPSSST